MCVQKRREREPTVRRRAATACGSRLLDANWGEPLKMRPQRRDEQQQQQQQQQVITGSWAQNTETSWARLLDDPFS